MNEIKYCKNCFKNNNSLLSDAQHSNFYAGYMVCFDAEKIKNFTRCPICGSDELINKPISEEEIDIIGKASNYNRELLDSMVELREKDIIEYNIKISMFRNLVEQQEKAKQVEKNKPKCPKCGSTNITTGQKGYSFWTGFLGSNKTVNRCGSCGHTWKP